MQQNNRAMCFLEEAEIAFFPFLDGTYDEETFPKRPPFEDFLGIVLLPPIFPHRTIVNVIEGGSCIQNKIPVGFSVYTLDHSRTQESITAYWNKIQEIKKKFGHITLWNIVPMEVYELLSKEFLLKSKQVYLHDPKKQNEQHEFAVTFTNRIKLYNVRNYVPQSVAA